MRLPAEKEIKQQKNLQGTEKNGSFSPSFFVRFGEVFRFSGKNR